MTANCFSRPTQPRTPATWFISDLHLGDTAIIPVCRRQFTSVQEMDELLIQQWRRCVHPEDDVVVLGDVTGSDHSSRERGLDLISRLPGRKILVPGNHEPMHQHDPDSPDWSIAARAYLDAGFAEVLAGPVVVSGSSAGHTEIWARNWELVVAHFPCEPAYFEPNDRYAAHRPGDTGAIVVHGHVHDAWKVRTAPAGTLQINVSPEVCSFAPTSLGQVMSLALSSQPDRFGAHPAEATHGSASGRHSER
jgi:calcineurin-like phosphoesterase family protein